MAMLLARASKPLLVATLAAALAGGCGSDGGSGAGSTGTGAARTATTETSGNLTLYTVDSAGFAIGAPKTWKGIDSDTTAEGIEKAAGDNATMKRIFDAMRQTGTKVRFVAADPKTTGDFSTSMNVVVEPVPATITLDAYAEAASKSVSSALGASPKVEKVTLPGGDAAQFSYSIKQAGRTLEYVQYAFIRDGNAYIVTYTTVPETGKQYDELFRESAESFRIL